MLFQRLGQRLTHTSHVIQYGGYFLADQRLELIQHALRDLFEVVVERIVVPVACEKADAVLDVLLVDVRCSLQEAAVGQAALMCTFLGLTILVSVL